MTAVPGGAADKAGNRYEDLWTAMRVADLLRGRASSMQLEPLGIEGIGIEFQIELSDGAWGEQTKHTADSWTIKRLQTQGVLAAAKQQIEQGRSYRLVTSSPASSLETLANRARSTKSLSEFKSSLSKQQLAAFDEVSKDWGDVDHEVSRARLTRIEVEQHPLASLLRSVRQAYEVLYAGDPGLVLAAVTTYCGEVLHQTITAPMVAAHLRSLGFQERLLVGDDNAHRQLHATIERQQRRLRASAPATGFVPRCEVQEILDELLAEDGPPLTLIDAAAGYGKSAVATEVAASLDD